MSHHFAIAPRGFDQLALHLMRAQAGAPNPFAASERATDLVVKDGIAVLPIAGTLTDDTSGYGWWYYGETPYALIDAQLAAAEENDDVRGIYCPINTFGGMVSGCWATAETLRKASVRGGGRKPIWASVKAADSAGYWLASACDRIVIEETGEAGSIGVILTHWDISEALAKYGEKVTMIFDGARKADGSPYEPLSPEARARFQAEVSQLANTFSTFVETYRSHAGLTLAAIKGLEADTRIGREAVTAKLADAVQHPNDTWDELKDLINGSGAWGIGLDRRITRLINQRRVNMAKSAARKKIAARKPAKKTAAKPKAGKELGTLLSELVDAQVSAEQTRDQVIEALAEAAGLDAARVNEIVAGEGDCPEAEDLAAFAGVLEAEEEALIAAAELDGCVFDETEPTEPVEEPTSANRAGHDCDCAAAVSAERRRLAAIAALPSAQANPGLALTFAAEGMSVAGVARALKTAGVKSTAAEGNRLISALDSTRTPIVGAQRRAAEEPRVEDALNPAAIYAARNARPGAK